MNREFLLLCRARREDGGSVLIIVLWVSFGLVALTLYFAHSMSFELRAADNRVAAIQAEQAVAGAARYCSNVIATMPLRGTIPDPTTYNHEAVPVGEAFFWFIGRSDLPSRLVDTPYYAVGDESSRLNINVATKEMLELLPNMPPALAAAIVDWRDADDEVTEGGAELETYQRLNPPYRCKNANFESLEELRLVAGAYLDVLYGEDVNQNGALDPNENDGEILPPDDNRDGRLDSGLLEYLTVYTHQPVTGTNVNTVSNVTALLSEKFSAERVAAIVAAVGTSSGNVLQFYVNSGMNADEFAQVEGDLIGTNTVGLININTASEAVLACIPGIGIAQAPNIVAYRRTNADRANSVAWLKDILDTEALTAAGPWVIGRTYQYSADIAAVGRHGRGYARTRHIIDTTDGYSKIIYRQDLSHLGWALGNARQTTLALARQAR